MINRHVMTSMKNKNIPFIISPVQFKILHYLLINNSNIIYQRDIEKIIESRRSTTSGILNTMERNNLIKRINSKKDARSKQIILTDYSKQISNNMINQKQEFEKNIQETITKEELEIFFKVTEKIKNNIMNMK